MRTTPSNPSANSRIGRNLLLRGSILAAMGALIYGCDTTVTVFDGGGGEGGATSSNSSSNQSSSNNSSSSSSSGGGVVCEGAQNLTQPNGAESGYAQCPDGTIHRYDAAIACDTSFAGNSCDGTETEIQCMSDADCTAAPNGVCASYTYNDFGGLVTACGCQYPCATDADCGDGQACICDGVLGEKGGSFCAFAGCADGADCDSNECGLSNYSTGCGDSTALGCREDSDVCRLGSDCETNLCELEYGAGPWKCTFEDCAIGRPLLLADGARTAPPTRRKDWSASIAPNVDLDPALAEALADHWQRVAALEHASVASFARFSLQLIALGAPPDLLGEAQAAASDEIEHARIAYALASAYSGGDIGPGPLDLSDMSISTSRKEAMLELVAEACVGETVGVAEARELAALCEDPEVAAIHHRIADDEQRHAQLAWRALAWMLEDADEDTRAEVQTAFQQAAQAAANAPLSDPAVIAPTHGLPSGEDLRAIRHQALQQVVLPCAQTLFA